MMKIVVTGARGQVGWELKRLLADSGEVLAVDRSAFDLAKPDEVRNYLRSHRPHVLVNAAAYTAVDRAEADSETAMAVNGVAPGVMAEEMRRFGGLMIHYSTDYVFDGEKAGAWSEEDRPNPLNAYGRSKLAGEEAVVAADGAHLVLRTSWVYGRRPPNFLLTMIRLATEKDELRVVGDQHGAPTWSRSLAEATVAILRQMVTRTEDRVGVRSECSGVYHAACGGQTTWHGFARAIVEAAPELGHRRQVRVTAIRTSEYPSPARRPANSILNQAKLLRVFGVRLPDWREALSGCLAESGGAGESVG